MPSNQQKSPAFDVIAAPNPLTEEQIQSLITELDIIDISSISGGLSTANLYKVTTANNTYAIRHTSGLFGSTQIQQEFSILRQAASCNCAPKVFFESATKGIVVMQYIDNDLPAGRNINILNSIPNSIELLTKLIRHVHQSVAIKPFYTARNPLDYIHRSVAQIPPGFLSVDDQALLDSILDTTYPTGDAVITHNDFRSSNVLYNTERFWLVDWELSGTNHPFYDIAYLANYQDMSIDDGHHTLELYLQRTPSKQQCSDFNYFRRVAFAFSATLALPGLANEPGIKQSKPISAHSVSGLWQLMDSGEIDIDNPNDEYQLSLFLLRQAARF